MKLRKMLVCLLIALIMTYFILPGTAVYGDDGPRHERLPITIGADYAFAPYEFLNDKGEPDGFCVELTKAIAKTMGLNVEIKAGKWMDIRENLQNEKLDMLEGMFYSKERDERFDFSVPYATMHYSVFIKNGTREIKTEEELKGKTIIVQKGDYAHDYLEVNDFTKNLVLADSYPEALRLLESGRYDCAVVPKVTGLYWTKKLGITDIAPAGNPLLPREYCYAALEGNSELIEKFNEGLSLLRENGEYDRIYNKWLGVLEPKGVPLRTIIKYSAIAFIPLAMLLAFVMLWSRSLKKQVIIRTRELEIKIAQLKETESELRQSDSMLSGIIENTSEGIMVFDREGKIILVNTASCDILGYPKKKLVGRHISDSGMKFIREDGSKLRYTETPAAMALEGNTPVKNTFMGVFRPDWSIRWLLSNAAPLCDAESGQPRYVIASLVDITGIKEADRALKETENKYSSLFINMPDGFAYCRIITDEKGDAVDYIFLEINDAFEKISGFTKQLLIGKKASEVISHAKTTLARDFVRDFGEVALAGRKLKQECFAQSLDRWYSLSAYSPIKEHFVLIINDISDRKRFEQGMVKMNEKLEQHVAQRTKELLAINRELEAFSYSVSHDLRAPLRSIDGFSRALLDFYSEELPEEGRQYLYKIRGSSQRMAQLIDDLLKLSRITRSELKRERVNLSQIAEAVAVELRSADRDRSVDFRIQEEVYAIGDESLLRVILENLLGNAWKYSGKRENAIIEFGMNEDGGRKVYYVKDNGVGFDMRYVDKLFGAFQRLHTSEEFEGTGIGLATVQRIINRHGGSVWAKGETGKGAEFYFTLDFIV